MQKKVLIKTYGCQMNEYDSAKIIDILAESCGFVVTNIETEADLIILNTCSIRAKAEEKLFSDLGRMRLIKQKKPELILAVGGCVAKQEQKNIFRRAPYVEIVFGPQTIHLLPELYKQALKQERKIINTSNLQLEKFDFLPQQLNVSGPTASISIMEGCNKFCSYCIVPYTRGREISRPTQSIINEIKQLTTKGVKEIYLLGQNVNAYRDPNNQNKLSDLLYETAKIKQIERIRFITSHPAEFTDDLIEIFTDQPKIVNHLHLPLQSGSNKILKLMRRCYTKEKYLDLVNKMRKVRPTISISTDIIVGFPGETEEEFTETLEFVRLINFDASFSFIYSKRPNTQAAKLEDIIPLEEKKKRLAILQNQINLQARKYSQDMIGTIQKVLINGRAEKNPDQFYGRTENNRIVNFAAPNNTISDIVSVIITEALTNSLRGKLSI